MKDKKDKANKLLLSAQSYIIKNRYKEAESILLLAIELLEPSNNINEILSICYKELITCYIRLNDLYNAKKILNEFSIKKPEEFSQIRMNLFYSFALYYEKTGDLEKALDYHEKQFEIEKEILKREKENYILNLKKRFEVEKNEKEKEIYHLKNIELKRVNFAKDKFLSIIAHDLKSPFATILSFISIMKKHYKHYTKEEILSLINELEKNVLNTYSLLKNLLEWSRLQSGTLTYNPSYFDLSKIIKKVINLENPTAKQKGITIINKCKKSIEIFADIFMIETVIRNLVSNSIKFTEPTGKITISAQILDNKIRVSVKDTGIGMEKKILKNLFKLDTSFSTKGTQNEKGSGLGLILCSEFIEKNKGKIFVESKLGKGTLFYFNLPYGTINNEN